MTTLVVASGSPFTIKMQADCVHVIQIPKASIPACTWWIIREYCFQWEPKKYFNSILMDDDGLSLICGPKSLTSLQSLGIPGMSKSPQKWVSLVINVTGNASELPGIVFYLANALSREKMSILHISTFESEVFLVQEKDIDKACAILSTVGTQKLYTEIMDRNTKRTLSGSGGGGFFGVPDVVDATPSVEEPGLKEGFSLTVLESRVLLARLNRDFPFQECSSALTKMFLFDERRCEAERIAVRAEAAAATLASSGSVSRAPLIVSTSSTSPSPSSSPSPFGSLHGPYSRRFDELSSSFSSPSYLDTAAAATAGLGSSEKGGMIGEEVGFMWGVWQCGEEVTLLLDENDVSRFPEGALEISPQVWRVIKLTGRPIAFDESGIVTAMSRIESGVPSLNISTATTNCTLVPEELLDFTLDTLSDALKCPVKYS